MKPGARWLPLGVVLAAKLALGLVVLTAFHGISDDDFARVFIAQGFAAAPKLDPSGTSWLPFPFWLTGATMLAFGKSLGVARVVAVLSGLLSTGLLFQAARWLGLSAWRASLAAFLGSLFPYAVYLGVATVPESLCAASIVTAVVCASGPPRRRLFGAALLFTACLSRYEAWPVALGFALLCVWDARKAPDKRLALAGATTLAVLGPLCWMLHGVTAYDNATFFVDRVAAYRRAIGAAPESLWARLSGYPLGYLRGEPELVSVALVFSAWLFIATWQKQGFSGVRRSVSQPWRRGIALLLLMLLSLIYGDLRDGAPTHHSERAVLALWMFSGLVVARALELLLTQTNKLRVALVGLTCVVVAAFILRPWYSRRDSFIDRHAAIAVGAAAKSKGATELAVATEDFGFYAVCVGFENPRACDSLRDNDPRKTLKQDPLASPEALSTALHEKGSKWVALPAQHQALGEQIGSVRYTNAKWQLVEAGD